MLWGVKDSRVKLILLDGGGSYSGGGCGSVEFWNQVKHGTGVRRHIVTGSPLDAERRTYSIPLSFSPSPPHEVQRTPVQDGPHEWTPPHNHHRLSSTTRRGDDECDMWVPPHSHRETYLVSFWKQPRGNNNGRGGKAGNRRFPCEKCRNGGVGFTTTRGTASTGTRNSLQRPSGAPSRGRQCDPPAGFVSRVYDQRLSTVQWFRSFDDSKWREVARGLKDTKHGNHH